VLNGFNMSELSNTLWNVLVELRKETLLAQETRAKLIAIKITTVSAGIGLIYTNTNVVERLLLLLPAIAAIFFDFLINSYSISTKKIGFYCRHYLEPGLIKSDVISGGFKFWEDFVGQPELHQNFSLFGNLGLTGIVSVLAIAENYKSPNGLIIFVVILALFIIDIFAHTHPSRKINKLKIPKLKYNHNIEPPNKGIQADAAQPRD
jgi:hypothetical protein